MHSTTQLQQNMLHTREEKHERVVNRIMLVANSLYKDSPECLLMPCRMFPKYLTVLQIPSIAWNTRRPEYFSPA
jgi:hypothetical protein